ncbi:hypothetical protein [Piscinibacter sp. XHJ-5]|uniref:hypothetical protein n=1 Tax=Piscinibacter sp. XHJ-5 TaxID=3037797 RepID=UPI002452A1B9|nr:hypothetical protein [Piscinibacter sp. XHJ-5]
MLVDVVCLRREGVKLPAEELRSVTPVRAFLTIDTVTLGPPVPQAPRVRKDVARLWQCDLCDEIPQPLDGLECARVSRVGGDALLLVGVERRDGSADEAAHPQAWWCRVVLDAEAPLSQAPHAV